MSSGSGTGQSGQTLIMFAITMTFMFLSLMALVGDADTLMVRYNQVNSAALLGAQAGASAIDEDQFYQGHRVLNQQLAEQRCKATAEAAQAGTGTANVVAVCTFVAPASVKAVVTETVTLPIPLFMTQATVSATRTGQAVFGGQAVDPGP